ncbi:MAG: leucine-rich repeat protein, partial [Eubacteriaceae bacterium]|nr:leucine-rich repeat protein [Eubacteriaceae bacterium]
MRRKYHCILLLIVGIMLLFSTTTLAAENNSTFATGKTFNEKCIELANGAENIETIVKSDVPLNKDNVISEQHSPEIYIGYEASTKTIWISSEKQMLLNEDSSEMFKGFTNLKKIDNFNVDSKNVKNISHFFEGCKSLESIDLTSWNLSNIKEMEGTFSGCESLKEIKFPTPIDEETAKKINEENAKKAQEEHKEKPADIAVNLLRPENITAGFFNCKNIEVIDLSIIRSDNLKKVDNTFNGCGKLKTIKTDRSLVFPAGEGVFAGTKELTGSNGTKWTEEHTNNEYARLDNYKQQGYFSNDKNTTVKIEGDNFETTGFVRDDSKNAWSDDYFKGTVKVKDGFEIESVIAELNGQNFTDFKQFEENGSFLIEVDKVPQEGVLFKITTKEKTQNIENKEDSKGEVSTENKSEEKV